MVKKTNEDGQESRERILAAARAEFAEKGFDGARVDEIARRADVNKALIYYYFKSKDELLQELLRSFLEERRKRRLAIRHDPVKRDLPGRVAEFDVDFLFEQRDILRIAMMEDLKSSKIGLPSSGTVLKHWLEGLAEGRDVYTKDGYEFRYTPRVIVAMYFYHLIPVLSFATLGETLANILEIDHATLREEFMRLVQETNAVQFQSVFGGSSRDPAPEVKIPGLVAKPPMEKSACIAPAPLPARPQAHVAFDPCEREAILSKLLKNGKATKFPLKEKARVALLEHLSGLFQPGRTYTEREVNEAIAGVVDDYAKARRYLVDFGYLDRKNDCSAYWSRG